MANERVFKIRIDGIEKSYTDVTRLVDVLNGLNNINEKLASVLNSSTKIIVEKTKSISDEEKAQAKLLETQDKATRVITETEKAQVLANIQLKERTQALKQQVQSESAADGSIRQIQATLGKLRTQYRNLSDEQRNNVNVGGVLEKQIKELDTRYKELEKGIGNNKVFVGEYEIASRNLKSELKDLESQLANMIASGVKPTDKAFIEVASRAGELRDSIGDAKTAVNLFASDTRQLDQVISIGKGLTATYGVTTGVMAVFGESGKEVSESMQKMVAVMTTLQSLQELQNQLTTKGTALNSLYTKAMVALGIASKSNIADTKALTSAQAANAVATGGATTATKIFSKALIATGVGAIVVLIGYLIANFEDLKKSVLNSVPALNEMGDTFDKVKSILSGVGEVILTRLLVPIRAVSAAIAKLIDGDFMGAIEAVKAEAIRGLDAVGAYQRGFEKQQERNRANRSQAEAKALDKELNNKIENLEAQYGADYKFTSEGRKLYAEFFANKKLMYDEDSDEYRKAVNSEIAFTTEVTKHDKDKAKERSDSAKKLAEDRKQALEDYKKSLESFSKDTDKLELSNEQKRIDIAKSTAEKIEVTTKDGLNKRNAAIEDAYNRQLVLTQKLALDEQKEVEKSYNELVDKAKKANTDKEKLDEELAKIEIERNERLAALRQMYLTSEVEINNEKNEKIKASNNSFTESEAKRLKDIQTLQEKNINNEIKLVNNQYKTLKDLQDNAIARSGKYNLIDVSQTKKNLDTVKSELEKYLATLNTSKSQIESYYNSLIATYKKDSQEYKDAVEAKKQAISDIDAKILQVNKNIKSNTQESSQVVDKYFSEISDKIQGHVSNIMTGFSAIFEATNTILDAEVEEANKKLDEVSSRYDEVVEQRKESSDRLKELEDEQKNARGGRVLILQQQIDQEIEANKKLADQEKQLANEKEKQEKELAKKERQQKKIELTQNIVQGVANIALGITKALSLGPIIGPILAAVVAASGAIQVGVMTKQLTKLEDGGLLKGKRHSSGGMRVEGTNIEVEGGEYVVNRESTAKNIGLIRYINNERRELNPSDINTYFDSSSKGFEPPFRRMFESGGQLPTINTSVNVDNEILIDAIRSMKVEPKVTVSDINRVHDQVVNVEDISGL